MSDIRGQKNYFEDRCPTSGGKKTILRIDVRHPRVKNLFWMTASAMFFTSPDILHSRHPVN